MNQLTNTNSGTFLQLNGQNILRGYGGLKSEVSNFKDALNSNVVLFDGAYAYKDAAKMREALVGRDVKQVIFSSKIPSFKLDPNDLKGSTINCFNEIIKDLGDVQSLNILYLHGPDCIHKDVLDVLVKLKMEGKIKHIGLSNVNKRTLETLINAGYPISVIQNEFNPYFWDKEVLDYCHEKKIVLTGYRPFGDKTSAEMFQNDDLKKIASRVSSSVQAVILQWMNQHGVTPIPHSNKIENIKANATVPQWTLTQAEIEQIDRIKGSKSSTCGWEKFLNQDLFAKSTQWLDQLAPARPKL